MHRSTATAPANMAAAPVGHNAHSSAAPAAALKRSNGPQSSSSSKLAVTNSANSSSNPSKRHRERLNLELDSLGQLLPYKSQLRAKLDKLSILRLAVAYLQVKTHFHVSLSIQRQGWIPADQRYLLSDDTPGYEYAILKALGGFIMVLNENGEIFFASNNLDSYLGFHQSDILHQPIFELVHTEDRNELRRILTPPHTSYHYAHGWCIARNSTLRFRCLLDNTCGFLRVELIGCLMPLYGLPACYLSIRPDPGKPVLGLVAFCYPLVPPLAQEPQLCPLLKSKHSLDLRLIWLDHRFRSLLNLDTDAQLPKSFYSLLHLYDLVAISMAHQQVIKTGASSVLVYRIYVEECNRLLWLQCQMRLFYKNAKPESISCTHRLLTEGEGCSLLDKRSMLGCGGSLALSLEEPMCSARLSASGGTSSGSSKGTNATTTQPKLRLKRLRRNSSASMSTSAIVADSHNITPAIGTAVQACVAVQPYSVQQHYISQPYYEAYPTSFYPAMHAQPYYAL